MTADGVQAADAADAAKKDLADAAREYATDPTPATEARLDDAYDASKAAHDTSRPLHGGS